MAQKKMMTQNKMPKSAKRRLTLIMPIVILAIGYFAFTLVTTGLELYKLHNEEVKLKEELKSLKGESSELKTEINKLQDKEYVARYARENYLYTRDGEYVIKVDDDEESVTVKDNKFVINEEYVIYGCIGFGVLIFLYVIRKSRKRRKKKMLKKQKK